MRPGEDLVEEPLHRLMAVDQVLAQRHDGFWSPMDTLKDQQWLEGLHESAQAPWQLWNLNGQNGANGHNGATAVAGGNRLMLPLLMGAPEAPPARLLVVGAHPDDIEIGCGGTILKLVEEGLGLSDLVGGAQR